MPDGLKGDCRAELGTHSGFGGAAGVGATAGGDALKGLRVGRAVAGWCCGSGPVLRIGGQRQRSALGVAAT